MIQINLLPEELRGRKRKKRAVAHREGPSIVVVLFVVAILLGDVALGLAVCVKKWGARQETKDLEADIQELDAEIKDKMDGFETLKVLNETLENQVLVLQSLMPPNQVVWAEKVNMLAYLVLPDAYITELRVTEESIQVPTKASIEARKQWDKSDKLAPEPEPVTVPSVTQTLTIEGVAIGEDERDRYKNAVEFWEALVAFEIEVDGKVHRFLDGFIPAEAMSPFDTQDPHHGRDVCRFEYRLKTEPMTAEGL